MAVCLSVSGITNGCVERERADQGALMALLTVVSEDNVIKFDGS